MRVCLMGGNEYAGLPLPLCMALLILSVWVIPSQGEEEGKGVRLVHGLGYAAMPCWSPDGKQIAFMLVRDNKAELWVVPTGGEGQPTQLTASDGQNRCPSWSPDGKSLAFEKQTGESEWRLFTVNLLTKKETEVPLPEITHAEYPRFSPDGKRLACHFTAPGNPFFLGIADLADPDAFLVTPFSVEAHQNCCYTNWSPDGKWLVFSMGPNNAKYDIFRTPVEGSGTPICLVKGPGLEDWASYSPDGTRLMYVSWPLYPTRINVEIKVAYLNKEGLVETTVTAVNDGYYPAWSPDGKRIVYGKDGDIWLVEAPTRPEEN